MSPILGTIGAMSESSYRGNLDDYANDFSFINVDNANPGTLYTSGIATITGINYKIKVSVVGAGASFSVNGDAFSTSPRFMRNGNEIRLALTTAQDFTISDFLKEYNVNVTAGKRTTTWTVKTRAINHNLVPFNFTPVTNLPVGVAITSNSVSISGLEPGYGLPSGVNGFGARISINGGALDTSGIIFDGNYFYINNPAAPAAEQSSYNQTRNISAFVGTYSTTWRVVTESADLTPDAFSFTSITGVEINTSFVSNSITVSGINGVTVPKFTLNISIFGSGFEYSKNGGTFTGQVGTVVSGDVIRLRRTTDFNYSTTFTGTLVIGSVSSGWNITTKSQPFDTIPSAFSFTSITNVARNTSFTSNQITLGGMTPGFFGSASVSGSGQFRVIRNGVTVRDFSVNSTNVQLGDVISLRDTSSSNYSTTKTTNFTVSGLDINGNPGETSALWNVTTGIAPILGCTNPSALNYNPAATVDDGSCIPIVLGCTNSKALNYNPAANVDNGTCISIVLGCTNPAALNYNPAANVDNGTCVFPVPGCTDPTALNYKPKATVDDGSCIPKVPGCTDPTAFNYNPAANFNNGTCIPKVFGCTDPAALNYNPAANTDDGSCIPKVSGCTDPTAFNYNPAANFNNGTCIPKVFGCTNSTALNYNPAANVDNGTCTFTPVVNGCTDPTALNYNPTATVNDGSCIPKVLGCTNPAALNYNPAANVDNGSCIPIVLGCTSPAAFNYNSLANTDNGTCIPKVFGCTNPAALNYNPAANVDNGTCIPISLGCTNPAALNYNPAANVDNGSCIPKVPGCTDPTATNYNPAANFDNGTCIPKVFGCTNKLASNYNPAATHDDGSCIIVIVPKKQGCTDPTAENYDPLAIIDDDTCIPKCSRQFPPIESTYGTGFQGYLNYNNGETNLGDFLNGSKKFITGLNSSFSGTIPQRTQFTYQTVSTAIINTYLNTVGRYPEGPGFDYWMNSFRYGSGTLNALTNSIIISYQIVGGEKFYQISKGRLNGNFNSCLNDVRDVRVTNEIAAIPGCTNPTASNYNPAATQDNGSCRTCVVPTAQSDFGTGFVGYLRYGNREEIPASNDDDNFITNLNSLYTSDTTPFTTAGGVVTTYSAVSTFIINHYVTNFGRYPEGLGYDYWLNDFIINPSYTSFPSLATALNLSFSSFESGYRAGKGGLVGNYDFCDVKRV